MPNPERFVKEAGLVFHHDIFPDVQSYSIPDPLILDLNQTSSNTYQLAKQPLSIKTRKLSQLQEDPTNALSLQHSLYHKMELSFQCSWFMEETTQPS